MFVRALRSAASAGPPSSASRCAPLVGLTGSGWAGPDSRSSRRFRCAAPARRVAGSRSSCRLFRSGCGSRSSTLSADLAGWRLCLGGHAPPAGADRRAGARGAGSLLGSSVAGRPTGGRALPAAARAGRAAAGRPGTGARAGRVAHLGCCARTPAGQTGRLHARSPSLGCGSWSSGGTSQRLVSHSVELLRLDAQFAIELSKYFALRADGGDVPSSLGRQDVVDFLVHLRARQLAGRDHQRLSAHLCHRALGRCCATRANAGCHRRPGPLAGLAEEFALV